MPSQPVPTASIIVGGDLCPCGRPEQRFQAGRAGEVFAELQPLLNAVDLAIANLECPLTSHHSPITKFGPHLHASPICAAAIRDAGFDVMSLANNHIRDMGPQGIQDTLIACQQVGLKVVGAGRNLADATRPFFVTLNGVRVAILAIAEHEFSIASEIASENSAGAAPLDLPANARQIQSARRLADFVLVLLHGGNEYDALPSPQQVQTCRFLVDVGAHAIVCSHAHVPSGMEIYCASPIVYGTGNLLFDHFDHAGQAPKTWFMGYLVKLSIEVGAPTTVTLIPYSQCRSGPTIRLLAGPEHQQFLQEITRLSQIIACDDNLLDHWRQFCLDKRVDYLSRLMCLTRPEQKLLHWGVWPFWRASKTQLLALLNTLMCQSHHHAAADILTHELLG